MFTSLFSKLIGTSHEREMRKIQPLVDRINNLEPGIKQLSDTNLKAKTQEFRQRLDRGEPLDSILPEAFAVCREASMRVLAMRHYDVQLIGGYVLNRGGIAEMKTGEGKTLVATLPMYLNALTGKGAHLVTVNDYLAKRDCAWMGELYNWLGLTTGTIVHEKSDIERKEAYAADITYGTNNEFGFDYLRDNMKFDLEHYAQRPFNFAIVDECDSILIDEARTPLIISGPADDSTDKYHEVNKIIPHLRMDVHFTMEEKSKTASLTEEGNTKVEELLGIENLYDPTNIELLHHVYQGLKAHHLYQKDVDYMVQEGEVIIVDEFTGRLMPGRRWSDGLHQAIEAKEKVKVKAENQTLASITFQNYFRMYPKLSGMTGTAETEAVEFQKIYNLSVTVIPTNKPIRRIDREDIVYKSELGKFKAIAKDIKVRYDKGQPVLLGTTSIEKSEKLVQLLKKEGVPHDVLNAKHHEREAEIVAQAGRKGKITIATNMAGRGTDIVLGGNPEYLAKQIAGDVDSVEHKNALSRLEQQCAKEKEEVKQAGGLCIVGTERHESRRIDNQLRGRAGRQGDPGESQFYLSLQDDLMRKFNGARVEKIMNMLKVPEDEPITARMVTRVIEGSQKKIEGHNFDIRKHLLDYDDVMNKQRVAIYNLRREVLQGEDLDRICLDMLGEMVSDILDRHAPEDSKPAEWDVEGLKASILKQFGVQIQLPPLEELNSEKLIELVKHPVKSAYEKQKETIGAVWPKIQKMLLLQTIDQRWKDHLQVIDRLKEGINLRAYAQKDPLVEYKKEAFNLFQVMNESIRSELVEKLLKIRLMTSDEEAAERMRRHRESMQAQNLTYQGSEASAQASFLNRQPQDGGPPEAQPGFPSRGGSMGRDQGPKLNRAQRRMMERQKKKRN